MSRVTIIRTVEIPTEKKDPKKSVGGKKTDNRVCKKRNIDDMISSVTYTRLPSGKTTVCEMILKNGFAISGVTSCVDVNNYDETLAKELSFKDAKNKLYEFAAYDLSTELFVESTKKEKADKDIECAQRKELFFKIAEFINNFVNTYMGGVIDKLSPSHDVSKLSDDVKKILCETETNVSKNITKMISWFISKRRIISEDNFTVYCSECCTSSEGTLDRCDMFSDGFSFMTYLKCIVSKQDRCDFNKLLMNAGQYANKCDINDIYNEIWNIEFKSCIPV